MVVFRLTVFLCKLLSYLSGRPILVLRDLRGYTDRDVQLFTACFQLLEDFVDREQPWEIADCPLGATVHEHVYAVYKESLDTNPPDAVEEEAKRRAQDWQALYDLYDWWTSERKHRLAACDLSDQDEYQLTKLVSLHRMMWT